jgi:flagellar hook-basal body complex protein FliE
MEVRAIPLIPDVAPSLPAASAAPEFSHVLDELSAALEGAQHAENAFATRTGSLQDAVYERARADVAVAVATAATGRVAQTVQSLLNMQV